MPLRDHFRPPAFKYAAWESVHGGWPMEIVRSLLNKLPPQYVAHPSAHAGAFARIDIAACEKENGWSHSEGNGNGAVATAVAVSAPPQPTLTIDTELPAQDAYEVKVYDTERGMHLVAAIELVSPANKDRPESRRAFVAKCAALLQKQVSVTIVDLITVRQQNLYGEVLDFIDRADPAVGTTRRRSTRWRSGPRKRASSRGRRGGLETWFEPMRSRPTAADLAALARGRFGGAARSGRSYEETSRVLRIA